MYTLPPFRDYQEDDYKNITAEMIAKKSIVYQAPTGSGKSVVISKRIVDMLLAGKKILFLSNRTHLQNQMFNRLTEAGVKNIGLFSSSNRKALECKVVLTTIQTAIASNNMELLLDTHFDEIVIDECHRSVTKSYLDVIRGLTMKNNNINLFGVTATPNRFDMTPLNIAYSGIVHCSKTMACLVNEGYLAKHRVFTIDMQDLEDEIESYGGDFAMESMSKYMRNPLIVKKCIEQYEQYAKGRSTIVYCVDKRHTVQMKEAYSNAGYSKSVIIDESVSESQREIYFEQFRTGIINLIFCIETLTEGLDLPNCNCVQLARPTKSMILYLQMVGRGLRPKEDGGDCVILDSSLNVSRLGMPTSDIHWDLGGKRHKKTQKKGKVVVYKNADGKIFFEQNEDVPFAEMIEVGFGELAEASQGLIEYAEEQNKRVYMEFYASFKELCLSIVHGAGLSMNEMILEEKEDDEKVNWNKQVVLEFRLKKGDVGFTMESSSRNEGLIMVKSVGTHRLDTNKEIKDYVLHNKLTSMLGDIANYINKNFKNIYDNVVNVRIDKAQLQDISELKKMQQEIAEERFMNSINTQLAKHGSALFKLDKYFNMNEYSTQYYGACQYIMIVNQQKLNVNNKVVFYRYNEQTKNLVTEHYTKIFKQDRLKDILERFQGHLVTDMSEINEIGSYEHYL